MGPTPSRCDDEYRTPLPSQSVSSVANSEPTLIEWRYGGKDVYVTGTFNGWRSKVPMKEYEKGVWRVKIYAPPGRVEYKFIVDGFWKYSPDQPRLQDQLGNTNNYINVIPSSVKDNDADNVHAYTSLLPHIEVLENIKPSAFPTALNNSPLNHHLNISKENQDTALLSIPDHTIIGHLFVNELGAGNIKSFSVSTRHDTKYVTTLMYFPKDDTLIDSENEITDSDGETKDSVNRKKNQKKLIKEYDDIILELKRGNDA